MAQMLQQLPSAPMGQGLVVSALSKTMLQPSLAALVIISIVAWSILFFFSSAILLSPLFQLANTCLSFNAFQ
jgi:uncharacterized protein HemY